LTLVLSVVAITANRTPLKVGAADRPVVAINPDKRPEEKLKS